MKSAVFRGVLSLVQVWDVARSTADIVSVVNARTTPVTSQSYTQGLTTDWAWDSYQPGPGMKKVSPSTRGQTICPTGQQLDTDSSVCIDKQTGAFPPIDLWNLSLSVDILNVSLI